MQISQLHEIIKRDLWSQGSELYKDNSCLPSSAKVLKDLKVNDFDELQVLETKQVKVSFRYKMKADIEMRVSVNLNTSDSVKEVKRKIRAVLKEEPLFEIKADSVVQITTRKECLRDEKCFGMLPKPYRDKGYWIHVTAKDAVTCLLCYPKRRDKRRNEGKTIIFIDPTKPTAFVRNEAAKYAGVDAKSIELLTECKEPVEEMDKVGDTNVIEKDCSLKVDINKKLPIVVQHPAKPEPDKITYLYALEHVFCVRQLVATHYEIDGLHIVLKCNGELMQDNELLKKYSIKKNTVLQLQVFEKRIHITVLILSKRRKMSLIIDDPSKSTVGDLLDFCANKAGYQSSNSKCLHGQRCLNNCSTLHAEGIQSGNLLIVVNFQDDENIPEGLFKLCTADQFGNITVSLGTVIGGYLLQAREYKKSTYENLDSKTERKSRFPNGIHVYECIIRAPVMNTVVRTPSPLEQNLGTRYTRETYSASSSSSGKEETYVKQLATSTLTHQQPKKAPQFFVGDWECSPSQSQSGRLKSQKEMRMQTTGQHELTGHNIETDSRHSSSNRQSVTELHVCYRHHATVPGSLSDSALSTVHDVVRAISPEEGRVVFPGEPLETSGITLPLLQYVSRVIGTDWRRLVRKLNISEADIAEIEHKYRESVSEQCYQALILWKKQKGTRASKLWLIEALKYINLNSLAESIEAMVEIADDSAVGSGHKTE